MPRVPSEPMPVRIMASTWRVQLSAMLWNSTSTLGRCRLVEGSALSSMAPVRPRCR